MKKHSCRNIKRKKKIILKSSELEKIKKEIKKMAKTIQEAVDAVGVVKTAQDAVSAKLTNYFGEVLNAINRLEAKLAAGSDSQPIIDALTPISQSIGDISTTLDVKTAEAQVTGV